MIKPQSHFEEQQHNNWQMHQFLCITLTFACMERESPLNSVNPLVGDFQLDSWLQKQCFNHGLCKCESLQFRSWLTDLTKKQPFLNPWAIMTQKDSWFPNLFSKALRFALDMSTSFTYSQSAPAPTE